jgi:hypothetical protein
MQNSIFIGTPSSQFPFGRHDSEVKGKVSLTYEIYGSASAGENGYWRWLIVSARSRKTLQVGSFYGPLPEAKKHAEAAVSRLKARIQQRPNVVFSRSNYDSHRGHSAT